MIIMMIILVIVCSWNFSASLGCKTKQKTTEIKEFFFCSTLFSLLWGLALALASALHLVAKLVLLPGREEILCCVACLAVF